MFEIDPHPAQMNDAFTLMLWKSRLPQVFEYNLLAANTSAWFRHGRDRKFNTYFQFSNMRSNIVEFGARPHLLQVLGDDFHEMTPRFKDKWEQLCEVVGSFKFISYTAASVKEGLVKRTFAVLTVDLVDRYRALVMVDGQMTRLTELDATADQQRPDLLARQTGVKVL